MPSSAWENVFVKREMNSTTESTTGSGPSKSKLRRRPTMLESSGQKVAEFGKWLRTVTAKYWVLINLFMLVFIRLVCDNGWATRKTLPLL